MTHVAAQIDLLSLKLFLAAVDERSIARAAAREHITTSAVSKRISDLESYFGSRLLIRRRHGVDTTAAGDALAQHCRAMLSQLVQLDDEMRDYRRGIRGQIRVSANESATIGYLPRDVSAFLAAHPEVTIDLQVETSPVVIQRISDKAADVGVFTGATPTNSLEIIPYRTDKLVAVLPSAHPLAGSASLPFSSLLHFDFIGSEADGAIESLTVRAASDLGRKLKTRIRVSSFDAACRFVEADLGVSVMTEAVATTLARALDIALVHLDEDWARRQLSICVRDRSSLPAATALFLEHLTAQEGQRPPGPDAPV